MTQLTERQQRESQYYDQYSQLRANQSVDFGPVLGEERRPWNPYWRLFQRVAEVYAPGALLVDVGCGWGDNTVRFARIGYTVEGVDISRGNLDATRRLAQKYGLSERVHCRCEPIESLSLPDASIDVVAGVDVLHHVEVEPTLRECHRILKPGGWAFFKEPVEAKLFDTLRNTRLVRMVFPNDASQELHVTEDERKLTPADLRVARELFAEAEFIPFRVLSRLDRLCSSWAYRLEKIDNAMTRLPGVKSLSGTVLMGLRR